jgi:hypothetical protein
MDFAMAASASTFIGLLLMVNFATVDRDMVRLRPPTMQFFHVFRDFSD